MNKRINKYRIQGKDKAHKDLLIRSLVSDFIVAGKMKTTPTKAKIIKSEFDKLVTKVKLNNNSGNNSINSFFNTNTRIISVLKKTVEEKLGDRNSGYTRIIRTLPRKGDNAEQVYIMLMNYEQKEVKSEINKVLENQEKVKKEKSIAGKIQKTIKQTTKSKSLTK